MKSDDFSPEGDDNSFLTISVRSSKTTKQKVYFPNHVFFACDEIGQIKKKRNIKEFERKKFTSICGNNSMTFAVNTNGKFVICRHGKSKPPEFVSFEKKSSSAFKDAFFKYVSCGSNHCVVIGRPLNSQKDSIYFWGLTAFGQSELGDKDNQFSNSFTEIPDESNKYDFIQVSCGAAFTLLLTEECQLLSFGENMYGQCGIDAPIVEKPTVVPSCNGLPIIEVATGSFHSLILTNTGIVYAAGLNKNNQLGIPGKRNISTFTKIESLSNVFIVKIAANKNLSAAIDEYGQLYLWGENFGEIPEPFDIGQSKQIVDVAICNNLCAVLTKDQEILLIRNRKVLDLNEEKKFFAVFTVGDTICGSYGVSEEAPLISGIPLISTSLTPIPERNEKHLRHQQTTVLITKKHMEMFLSEPPCENVFVKRVFSSLSLLNGSFLTPESKDFTTKSGIDEEDLINIFKRLTNIDEIKEAYYTILDGINRTSQKNPIQIYSLRFLYIALLMPPPKELINREPLALVLSLIKKLRAEEKIKLWISAASPSTIKAIINNVNGLLSCYIKKGKTYGNDTSDVLDLIQIIYQADIRSQAFNYQDFYNPSLNNLSVTTDMEEYDSKRNDRWSYSKRAPYLLSLDWKNAFVVSKVEANRLGNSFRFTVDRRNIFGSFYSIVNQLKKDFFRYPIVVSFLNEPGIDQGGLKREFFELIVNQVIDPAENLVISSNGLCWFNPKNKDFRKMYTVGVIIGMSIFNRTTINLRFPLALYKKMRDISVDFDDLADFDPEYARSLLDILTYEGDVENEMCLDFTYKGEPIIEGGENIPVTAANRRLFVDRTIDYIFNKSVEKQFNEFRKGFMDSAGYLVLNLFYPQELCTIINGIDVYDFTELMAVTRYEGYTSSSPAVKIFWDIVNNEFTQKEKGDLLAFVTSSSRIPVGGLKKINFVISIDHNPNHIPTSHTCFFNLVLPNITSKSKMRKNLRIALDNNRGFNFA